MSIYLYLAISLLVALFCIKRIVIESEYTDSENLYLASFIGLFLGVLWPFTLVWMVLSGFAKFIGLKYNKEKE